MSSTDPTNYKVGIVYSATTASNYWSEMAYSQLFMAVQSQAAMAGVPYDILSEGDLAEVSRLVEYDALVFPGFRNVRAADLAAIEDALTEASQAHGVGIIAAGDFMTNDENGVDLPDAYSRMQALLGLEAEAYGSGDIDVRAGTSSNPMMADYAAGELIHRYSDEFYGAYKGVSGVAPDVLVQQTIGSDTYNAVLATIIGSTRNVHFSSDAVMADNNLLWQAIDYAVHGDDGASAGLQLSRNPGILAARVDMDQAMFTYDVTPGDRPGIYDLLLPILESWKETYGFVGSLYVDIGNVPPDEMTDWAISGEYYRDFLTLGYELGSHSYTHPHVVDALTLAELRFEFEDSKTLIEQQMSQILGQAFNVEGAAVPGNPESLETALSILENYRYLSGGFSSIGAGYPGALGYLTPDMAAADKVYLAPDVSFDFSLVEFQGMTPAQAELKWQQEWSQLTSHAEVPVLVWPWHDYGAAAWSYDGETDSLYTTAMFENFIASAYASGIEFVTLGDLAERISAFEKSQLTWSRLGDTVTATVSSSDAGRFALDLDDLGTNKIANVAGWYAYDDDSVFLPRAGGTYAIQLGADADNVTRITSLPLRSELVSLTGDGTNLSFQLVGEGRVVVDLADPSGHRLAVSGADVVSVTGDTLTLALRGNGAHDVGISLHRVSSGNTAIDFNADGSADILWRHSDGSLALWEISGANASAHVLDVVPSSWSLIEAHGDYNGDGKSDLVWRHSDGSVATWEMSGGNATGRLFGVVPTSWSLIDGHGDYNGDGKSDLLWRNSDGTVATWEMTGALFTGHVLGIVPLGWSVIDSHGDYNGDGKNDLLWRHTDGTVATWHMNGADMTGQLFGLVPESWRLLDGHGDYNGDGKSDLLWRDSDGTVALWQMDGATFSGHVLGVVPGNWSLIDGHGDYNGDAISDLLWRHEDGTVAIWQMNGAVFSGHVLSVVPSSWSLIEGHSDYNGDGRSDVLWRDSDGTVAVWQMDGAQFASHILPVVPSGWQVSDATEMGATLNGDDADNILSGTVGRDTLRGGLGNDTLTGGAGSDRYVYGNIGEGGDTIYGFTPGSEGDVLDVREILVGYTPGSSNLADFVRLTESGGNTIVSIDADGTGGDFVALTTLQAVTGLLVADLHAQGNLLVA